MGERDAFGRDKDENPLESLGWTRGDPSASRPTPAPHPTPAPRPDAAGHESLPGMTADVNHDGIPGTHAPPGRTFPEFRTGTTTTVRTVSAGSAGRLVRVVILLSIGIAVLAGAAGSLVDRASDEISKAIDDASPSPVTPSPAVPATPGSPATPATPAAPAAAPSEPPVGLGRGSLLLRSNFATAMKRLRTGGYGRLTNLRVAPDRIDATMLTQGGRLRQVQVQPGGKVRVFGTSGPGFAGKDTMSIAGINTAAPARLTKSGAGRLKQPASKINYLVYTQTFGTDLRWYAFFKGGQTFGADSRGRITRRIN
ncbi:hypothetical protein [Paraconexibacter sp.]|uniref:hypothetical protein n=1 Tax=Paraconexibacter sp. TaxID=2949640 RepID=UPI003563E1F8